MIQPRLHPHDHKIKSSRTQLSRRLLFVASLTFLLFLVELIGGILSQSLALLSDAGHMLADLLALSVSILSIYWGSKPADENRTFGYYRIEILASLFNGVLLLWVAFQIVWEAFQRFLDPKEVLLSVMVPIAILGLIVNVIGVLVLHRNQDHLVGHSAFLHVLSDLLASLGVLLGAALIYFTGVHAFDPMIAILLAILIGTSAFRLLREAIDILLESSPKHLELVKVKSHLESLEGIFEVHDLHVWTISSGYHAASLHALVQNCDVQSSQRVIQKIQEELAQKFSIGHVTVQIEVAPRPRSIDVIAPELK